MKTLIDVLTALSDFVKVASEWAESASKAEVETFTQIYPQKEEAVKKAVEKAITLEEVRSVLANLSRSGQKETVLKLLQKYGGSRLSEVPPERRCTICRCTGGSPCRINTPYSLLPPVPDGWRVRPPHSFVLPCRIP